MARERAQSHIEIAGTTARFYDELLWILSLGGYQRMLRKAVAFMDPRPGEAILDMGSGTGYVACLVAPRVGPSGRVVGLDIGREMLRRARGRCRRFPWVEFQEMRIEEPLPYREEFQGVFISFVLHGFPSNLRRAILANAHDALRPGGRIVVVDYGRFDLKKASPPVRALFRWVECPLAREFIELEQREMLAEVGFGDFRELPLWGPYIHALGARKPA